MSSLQLRKQKEAVTGGVLCKKGALKNFLQNLRENSCIRISFLIKLQVGRTPFLQLNFEPLSLNKGVFRILSKIYHGTFIQK